MIPDVTRRHWSVNIRKYVVRATTLDELVGLGSLTPHAAAFLQAAVRAGLNVLVSGGTQAGKTTLLNALAGAIPARERVITCEEVFELRLVARDWVAMQCRQPSLEGTGEIPLRRLVKEALRMRPNRLLVGEVREAEALDLLIALNAGVPAMCTIHANSAREALTKLCTLPLLAGENVSDRFVVPTVASAVDLVVHLDLDAGGRRRGAGDRRASPAASSRGSWRPPTSSTRATDTWSGPTATRRTPSGSPARGSTWPRCCEGGADGGRRRAAARGRGRVHLVVVLGRAGRSRARRARPAGTPGRRTRWSRRGSPG